MEETCKLRNSIFNDFTKEEEYWLNVLSQNKNYKENEFINKYLKRDITLSIFQYRNFLLEKQNSIDNLDKSFKIMEIINNKDISLIKKEFERMFLEPLEEFDVKIIAKKINIHEQLLQLIQLHNLKRKDRLMALLTLM